MIKKILNVTLALAFLPLILFIQGCSDTQDLPEKTYWFTDEGDNIAIMENGKITFKILNEDKRPPSVFTMKSNGDNKYQLSNPEMKTTDFASLELSPEVKMIKAQFGTGTMQRTLILHLAPSIEKDQLPTTTYFYEKGDDIESSIISIYNRDEDSLFFDEQYISQKNKDYQKSKSTTKVLFTDGLIFEEKTNDKENHRYYIRSLTDTSISFVTEDGTKWTENIVNEATHPEIPAGFTERSQ